MVLLDLQSVLASLQVQYRLQVLHFQKYLFPFILFPPHLPPHASPSFQSNQVLPIPLRVQCSLGTRSLPPWGLPRPWQKNPWSRCWRKRLVLLCHCVHLSSHSWERVHRVASSLRHPLSLLLSSSIWTSSPSIWILSLSVRVARVTVVISVRVYDVHSSSPIRSHLFAGNN